MSGESERTVRRGIFTYLAILLSVFVILFIANWDIISASLEKIWYFPGIGIAGAIIANATGTGGGIVFVPVFDALGSNLQNPLTQAELTASNKVAIAFLIQCFGMSIGSMVWTYRFYGGGKTHVLDRIEGNNFVAIVFTVLSTTLPALILTQNLVTVGPAGSVPEPTITDKSLILLFKSFSLILGIFLLIFTWKYKRVKPHRFRAERFDIWVLMLVGALGGFVTALFSVGVGEFVALYLIFRKFPTVGAVAAAVVITAPTVITGIWFHNFAGNIRWDIGLMTIPGALVGGFVARPIATTLGPLWLKTWTAVLLIFGSAYLLLK